MLRCLIGTNIWVCPHLDAALGHVGCACLGMMLIAAGEVREVCEVRAGALNPLPLEAWISFACIVATLPESEAMTDP